MGLNGWFVVEKHCIDEGLPTVVRSCKVFNTWNQAALLLQTWERINACIPMMRKCTVTVHLCMWLLTVIEIHKDTVPGTKHPPRPPPVWWGNSLPDPGEHARATLDCAGYDILPRRSTPGHTPLSFWHHPTRPSCWTSLLSSSATVGSKATSEAVRVSIGHMSAFVGGFY